MKSFIAFIVGVIFAFGLGVSGMTETPVVKGFLDIFGDWNYALVGVMGGAIAVHAVVFYFVKNRQTPLLDTKFHLPTKKDIDKKLLLGSAIFGLGWGWAGICPGPGIVSLLTGKVGVFIFIIFLLLGMGVFKLVDKKLIK